MPPAKHVAILGGGVCAAQCALILAELGVDVTLLAHQPELDSDVKIEGTSETAFQELLGMRPLLLRAASHPRVDVRTGTQVDAVTTRYGRPTVRASRRPRYVRQELCTSCGSCEEVCSAKVPFLQGGRWLTHTAIHPPMFGINSIPSAYLIEKKGIAPCTAACPLGINVQGFVSLLAVGKVNEALALINQVAPLASVLGRVCTHPCEDRCKRSEVDEPVFIRALHRYAADYAVGDIRYTFKERPGSRREKIAVIGSGPAGLSAAWELARRGYTPVIFESHAVIGGMLATGIPRFRLPREVREREVKAIESMGVQMRTGITLGRDVAIPDLRERGYKAFFLAIGAHENHQLNIPGEDLEGVVDCTSLLFELNLKVGASVGRNVVVIGGGNSAVDSARSARRRGRRNVTILYRRTSDEMTAVKEDVEEALNEGVTIRYLTAPIEILGDGVAVKGVRCQKMKLGKPGPDGRREPVPVSGSEFFIEADHVVVAIGQRPDILEFTKRPLDIDPSTNAIIIDPITLETNVPAVFAGGDCVTGPNSVVDAVAAGLRGAESIDRFLRGRSLTRGERGERPRPVEVDVAERYASPYKRASMPFIPRAQRMGTFEETSMGLPSWVAEREAGRCLSCALCSSCLQCESACEVKAIHHEDEGERIELHADAIIDFGGLRYEPDEPEDEDEVPALEPVKPGVFTFPGDEGSLERKLTKAAFAAMEVASALQLTQTAPGGSPLPATREPLTGTPADSRALLALCSCGDSISSVIDFSEISAKAVALPGIFASYQVLQACTPEGAASIARQASIYGADRILLAACRCCNLDQICLSCTDRRIMCRDHLLRALSGTGTRVDFINIREHCAWVHKDDPDGATAKALDLINSSAARASGDAYTPQLIPGSQPVVVLNAGVAGLAAARCLSDHGWSVNVVTAPAFSFPAVHKGKSSGLGTGLKAWFKDRRHLVKAWPHALRLSGSPGRYELMLEYESHVERSPAAAVIYDASGADAAAPLPNAIQASNLLGRLLSHEMKRSPSLSSASLPEHAGVFMLHGGSKSRMDELVFEGTAIAAKVWVYLMSRQDRSVPVQINWKLCRGCGDCAKTCPYIEMKSTDIGPLASVDPALCIGCGICIPGCPSGAISQGDTGWPPASGLHSIPESIDTLVSK